MTLFDLFVLALLGLSILFAWIRGASREISTLIALAIAGGAALLIATPLGRIMGANSDIIIRLVIMTAVFVITFMLTSVGLDMALTKFLSKKPSSLDKWLGASFGFVRGYVLLGLVTLIITHYYDNDTLQTHVRSGFTYGIAESAAGFLNNFGISTKPDA